MMFRKNKSDFKAKLEHKLYLARENPEPIFDLSDCGLRQVPGGVYSLCRVFLKESLLLDHNKLTSLTNGGTLGDLKGLKLLNIQHNAFTSLPEEIALLTKLKELYINNNNIKQLPKVLGSLANLRVLDVSCNLLKILPPEIGNLCKLQHLNITGNKDLNKLPQKLCCATQLISINLDAINFVHPPSDVAIKGTEAIMKFLCEENGIEYTVPSQLPEESLSNQSLVMLGDETDSNLQEQRQKELLKIEKDFEKFQQQEFELQAVSKANRQKILTDITEQQYKLESELAKIQGIKEVEQTKLIKLLYEEEIKADLAINQLLALNKEPLSQLLEQERLEEERLLSLTSQHNETLRRNDILSAMQTLLEEETNRFKRYDLDRVETARSVLSQEMLSDGHLAEILKIQGAQQAELVLKLHKDMELQRIAVGALLERGDARSWSLVQQVHLVETQLAKLTAIEMDRRKLQIDEHLNDLSEKRTNLSMLLVDLLEQQGIRRAQLLSTLQNMEKMGQSHEDFWLLQYQQLLDRRPESSRDIQRNIDPEFAHELLLAGVINYLPFLAHWAQTAGVYGGDLIETDLIEAGVKHQDDRELIIQAFQHYKKLTSYDIKKLTPMAPNQMTSDMAASAPVDSSERTTAILSTECVICMDSECEMIFVPCGHMCCCVNCAFTLDECPLCRGYIERKIKVLLP